MQERVKIPPSLEIGKDAGSFLRSARISLGYSVEEISLVSGLTVAEINNLEMGSSGIPSNSVRLGAALNKFT